MKAHWKRYLFIFFLLMMAVWIMSARKPRTDESVQSAYFRSVKTVLIGNERNPPVDVLVVSGGGSQGIIPLHVLTYLEKKTHKPVSQLFDLMVGSSTGAIITMTLDVPDASHQRAKYSAAQLLGFYNQDIPRIFHASIGHQLISGFGWLGPKYNADVLYQVFQELLGNTELSQVLLPLAFPAFDLQVNDAYLFKSWEANLPGDNYRLSEALAAAVATPMIFKPYRITSLDGRAHHIFVDGGVVTNTPEILAYLEATKLYPTRPVRVISLGDGDSGQVPAFLHMHDQLTGLFFWVPQLADMLIHGRTKLTNIYMADFVAHPYSMMMDFWRINIFIPSQDQRPFSGDPKYLRMLNTYGEILVKTDQAQLDKLADQLLQDKQAARGWK